jgi:hypothetical protein
MTNRLWMPALLMVLPFQVAHAADWQEFAADTAGNRYSIDQHSIVREGATVKGVVRAEYASPRIDPTTDKGIFSALDRVVVNCETAGFALQARSYVLADGKEVTALASTLEELTLRPAAAGSISESIVRSLCGKP